MCQMHSPGNAFIPPGRVFGRRVLLAGAGGAAGTLALSGAAHAGGRSVAQELPRVWAIVGGTVVDSVRAPIRDAVVLVVGDRIAWVGQRGDRALPARVEVVDARGKYVLPGLVEAHHHLGGLTTDERAANLRRLLDFGFTTVFDPAVSLADLTELKSRAADPDGPYPRFLGTGPMLGVPGGWGDFGGDPGGRLVPNAAAAELIVAELAAAGADAIKAANDNFAWGGRQLRWMPVDIQRAIVSAARRQGLRVFFHAPAQHAATEALQAGAAGLLHGIVDRPVSSDFLRLLRSTGATYLDTLTVFEAMGDLVDCVGRQQAFDRQGLYPTAAYDALRSPEAIAQMETIVTPAVVRQHLPNLRGNVRPVAGSGVNVALGADGGTFGQALGLASQFELFLHGQHGMRPAQVLRAATLGAARMLGRERQLGSVAPGKLADLVVLDANPLADLRNLHFVHRVVKNGRLFRP